MIDSVENVAIIAAHIKAHGVNPSTTVYTAKELLDAMWLAVCESFSQLKFDPLPQKLYMTLLEARNQRLELRDKARRDREAAENLVPFDLAARGQEFAKAKTKEELKQIDDKCREERERIIHDFSVNSTMPGRLDHGKSEEGRAYLRKIKITGKDGKFSEPLTLEAVRACMFCDEVEQMKRALDRWLASMNETTEEARERQRQIESSGFVGSRGQGTRG